MKSNLHSIRLLIPTTAALALLWSTPAHAKPASMDSDGDGFVSSEEFTAAKKKLPPKKAAKQFKAADTDGDGKLSSAEVKAMKAKKGDAKPKQDDVKPTTED